MTQRIATKHWLWRRWTNIQQSINNPNCHDYQYAGGRGVGCYWLNFWDFADWVEENLGKPPKNRTRLGRIDTDSDYRPGNLFWTNQRIHNNMNHSARLLTCKGKTMSMSEWSRHRKIVYRTLFSRIQVGWPIEQALNYEKRSRQ